MEAAAASDDSARRQEGAALERQREDQGAQLRLAATMGRRASQGDSESQESQPSGSGPLPKRRRSDMAEDFLRIKEDTLRMEMEDRRRARDEAREEARLQREALRQFETSYCGASCGPRRPRVENGTGGKSCAGSHQ
jgi:hypothetical protein